LVKLRCRADASKARSQGKGGIWWDMADPLDCATL
jgi:hypothetical protein